jgi:membrane fusion protein, multidrug efflux system
MDQLTPTDEKRGREKTSDEEQNQEREAEPFRLRDWVRHHWLLVIISSLVFVAAVTAGVLWWLNARHYEWSDDAFIDSRQFAISSKVAGYVADVKVTDNQRVREGTLLVLIDDRDYRAALKQAEARLAEAEASVSSSDAQIAAQKEQVAANVEQEKQSQSALVFAKQEDDRAQQLVKTAVGTVQRAEQTKSQLDQAVATLSRAHANTEASKRQVATLEAQRASAVATVDEAKANRDIASLNLSYTILKAAQAGTVVQLSAAKGQYAQAGQNLMMFVPSHIWITANFKETQITDMRPGQRVTIEVDAYPGRELKGHVDSIQAGSGTAFSLLPAENATGNYVKVVQRVPVKIEIDAPPSDIVLGPGMSVVPEVRVR